MPSTRLASARLSIGTTTVGQPSLLAANTAGNTWDAKEAIVNLGGTLVAWGGVLLQLVLYAVVQVLPHYRQHARFRAI